MSLSSFFTESRRTLHLAVPIIIGNVGQTMITFTDTLMVGRLGANELAAAGFAGNLFIVFMLFGFGILAPVAAVMAHSHGREASGEIAETLRLTVVLTSLVSVILMIALWAGSPLLAFMGQTDEVVELSKSFFSILVLSLLPSLLFHAYKQLSDGLGHPRVGMYVTVVAILFNAIANYILIHGWGVIPALGLNGAAIATVLTRVMMAVALIVYVYRLEVLRVYRQTMWQRDISWTRMGSLFRLGLPNGLTYVFEAGAFTFSSVMMGWLGAEALAAHQIALNLASISFLVTVGIGVAVSIRVGFELGQGRFIAARLAGRTAILLGALFMLLSAVLVFTAREPLARLYTKDAAVIAFAASFLVVAAAFQFFDGIQAVAIGALRGLQDTKWPSILAFIAYWAIGLPVGYYLGFEKGMNGDGIWWGLFVGLAFTAIFLTVRFERRLAKLEELASHPVL